jgi:hypothetical protein
LAGGVASPNAAEAVASVTATKSVAGNEAGRRIVVDI